jgi:Na+/melibiose symporter-like transporter
VQIVAHGLMAIAQPGQYWQAAIAFGLIGVSFSSWYVIPTSLVADTVDYGKLHGGTDAAGLYMALFNFVDKAALAAAALIALPILDHFGFKVQGGNTRSSIEALRATGCLLPIAIISIAGALYWRYPLDRFRHGAVLNWVRRREQRALSAALAARDDRL